MLKELWAKKNQEKMLQKTITWNMRKIQQIQTTWKKNFGKNRDPKIPKFSQKISLKILQPDNMNILLEHLEIRKSPIRYLL